MRIGLHVGEAEERDGDYFGPTVNMAARVMAAGHGGQVLAIATFAAAAGVEGVDIGRYRLAGFPEPVPTAPPAGTAGGPRRRRWPG